MERPGSGPHHSDFHPMLKTPPFSLLLSLRSSSSESQVWIVSMVFSFDQWCQKEKCVWDSPLKVQRKTVPNQQGAPYFLCTGDANHSWTLDKPLYQQGTACVQDKQILARQERGVPLGSMTSASFFPGLSAGSYTADTVVLWTPLQLGWSTRLWRLFWRKYNRSHLQIPSMTP